MATKSFLERRLERRHEDPEYDIEAWITGVRMPDGLVQWSVNIEGEDDCDIAAGILERAAEVLRDKSIPALTSNETDGD